MNEFKFILTPFTSNNMLIFYDEFSLIVFVFAHSITQVFFSLLLVLPEAIFIITIKHCIIKFNLTFYSHVGIRGGGRLYIT